MELSYLDTVINTEISQFNTSIPMIGSAFDAFLKTVDPGKALMMRDIPDFRAVKKPFSTYAGDTIYCSSIICNSASMQKRHIKGLSALASAVNGFSITLPQEFSESSEDALERLHYYILPDKKPIYGSNVFRIGVVTSSPSFLISVNSDTSIEINRKTLPTAICVNNTQSFTAGFIDAVYDRLHVEQRAVIPEQNVSASDIAAYRLGLFYADSCLPKLKKPKAKFSNSNATVYTFAAHTNPDGTPNIAYIQYIFSLLAAHDNIIIQSIQSEKYDDLGAALGPSFSFSSSCDVSQLIKPNSFVIITPQKLPLTVIGSLQKSY